jgi:DNA-binding transcriptional ArsR family regulator
LIDIELPSYCVDNEEAVLQRVHFSISPLHELLRSLHVLRNPKHHGIHLPWVMDATRRLDVSMRQELEYFALCYELGVPPSLMPGVNETSLVPFEEELARLSALDPGALLEDLGRISEHRENEFLPNLARGLEWEGFAFVRSSLLADLERDPTGVLDRFSAFVSRYWEEMFASLWNRLEEHLLGDIVAQSRRLRSHGFASFVGEVSDRIRWKEHDAVLSFRKPFHWTHRMDGDESLTFLPSYFVWPHLFVDVSRSGVVVVYDSSRARREAAPTQPTDLLVGACRALGEPTRIKLLTMLQKQPLTTQGLAQTLHLSEGAISRHLQVLKHAKLVTSEQHGKYVLYRCRENLLEELSGFVARATAGQGGAAPDAAEPPVPPGAHKPPPRRPARHADALS